MESVNGHTNGSSRLPRILIIGAGSRGNAYARAVKESGIGIVAAVADPIRYKRRLLGSKYIWSHETQPSLGQEFEGYQQFVEWETQRRADGLLPAIDGVFICVLDEQHADVVTALAPLNLHIMCEKPLATSLSDCLRIYSSLLPSDHTAGPPTIFGIGHVLRYSPHNMLLRQLVLEDEVIGDVLSVEHTEPVGSLKVFRQSRKPVAAGTATNCLSCPIKDSCMYSAPKIYYDKQLAKGNTDWPVAIVNPEIESALEFEGAARAREMLFDTLKQDYDEDTPKSEVDARPWFGRCVWESDNDVCDDQFVTITWDDEADTQNSKAAYNAKTATFHMIANTEKQCERRGRIYGTKGEIEYDGTTIKIFDFATESWKTYNPPRRGGGHGGGDDGLAQQFLKAITAVQSRTMTAEEAQIEHLGCTLREVIRSHALVFAAEEARRERKVVDWNSWWATEVEAVLKQSRATQK
ncbi:hypothetical protein MBLNU457_4961t1 [Dothideomycetes sp. NU457]